MRDRLAHSRIGEARERFRERYGSYPSVMYVGGELYKRAWPAEDYLAQAIAGTLVVPKDFCGSFGLVIPLQPRKSKDKNANALRSKKWDLVSLYK